MLKTLKRVMELKKGQAAALDSLVPIALAFVVGIVVLSVGATVVTDLGSSYAAGTAAANVTTRGGTALNNIYE